jgi:hypothetical protein
MQDQQAHILDLVDLIQAKECIQDLVLQDKSLIQAKECIQDLDLRDKALTKSKECIRDLALRDKALTQAKECTQDLALRDKALILAKECHTWLQEDHILLHQAPMGHMVVQEAQTKTWKDFQTIWDQTCIKVQRRYEKDHLIRN